MQPDGSIRLRAMDAAFALDLVLKSVKPPLLHGEQGYSRKGAMPGNASIYYSLTDLESTGSISTGEGKFAITSGQSWMDHEFGTSFLEIGQQGWDWFSLHLGDGSDLMLFQIRRRDGSTDPSASGTLRLKSGEVMALRQGDFTLTPGKIWVSPETGAKYPVEWQVEIPKRQLKLNIGTPLASQEMTTRQGVGPSYWEGAVDAEGTAAGQAVLGRGYLEMTGYNNQAMTQFFSLTPAPPGSPPK
jgi:predicted secreted hydrolase